MTEASPIGVVIVAHDREEIVARAVRSIFAQRHSWERIPVVLVDSASKDGTAATLERMRAEAPGEFEVAMLREPSGGAARARNLGWEALDTLYVAFLDDDAEAELDWLARGAKLLANDTTVAALAGRTLLRWLDDEPPAEVVCAAEQFTALDYGARPRYIRYPRAPIGPNMILRRCALEMVEGFDADLGPAAGRSRVGEEGELTLRLARCGWRTYYSPELRVHHLASSARITLPHLLERARVHGLSRCLVDWKHFGVWRAPHQVARWGRALARILVGRRKDARGRCDLVYAGAYFRTLGTLLRGGPVA